MILANVYQRLRGIQAKNGSTTPLRPTLDEVQHEIDQILRYIRDNN
jgi:hypothetical protein